MSQMNPIPFLIKNESGGSTILRISFGTTTATLDYTDDTTKGDQAQFIVPASLPFTGASTNFYLPAYLSGMDSGGNPPTPPFYAGQVYYPQVINPAGGN